LVSITTSLNGVTSCSTRVGKLVQWAGLALVACIHDLVASASWSWSVATSTSWINDLTSSTCIASITVILITSNRIDWALLNLWASGWTSVSKLVHWAGLTLVVCIHDLEASAIWSNYNESYASIALLLTSLAKSWPTCRCNLALTTIVWNLTLWACSYLVVLINVLIALCLWSNNL